MNIIDTWLKSFSALSPPEKVGWSFVCIIMILTISPEIKFVFLKLSLLFGLLFGLSGAE